MPRITFKLPGGFNVDVGDSPSDGQVLTFNSSISLWDAQDAAGGGEDNTSSNSGAGDGWALAKVGVDLPFKSFITSSPLATTVNASDLTITIDNIAFTLLADGTDGELITWDAAGAPAAVAVGTSGQVLTSNGAGTAPTFQAAGGGGGLTFAKVVKTVDETVNNSATLQDDDVLLFTPAINKTYFLMCMFLMNSDAIPDIKFSWSIPTGATMTTLASNSIFFRMETESVFTRDWTSFISVTTDGTDEMIGVVARLVMSSNAGNAILQWAQVTATVADTNVLKGSTLLVWEEGSS